MKMLPIIEPADCICQKKSKFFYLMLVLTVDGNTHVMFVDINKAIGKDQNDYSKDLPLDAKHYYHISHQRGC